MCKRDCGKHHINGSPGYTWDEVFAMKTLPAALLLVPAAHGQSPELRAELVKAVNGTSRI